MQVGRQLLVDALGMRGGFLAKPARDLDVLARRELLIVGQQ